MGGVHVLNGQDDRGRVGGMCGIMSENENSRDCERIRTRTAGRGAVR